MAATILGFNKQALLYSFILFCYTTSYAITYYGVLPQRVIHFTCLEQQHRNATLTCDSTLVAELSTKRIAYLNIAYSGASFLTNGPLSRYADLTSNRKRILLWIIFGLTFDQISQVFTTSYLQLVVCHALAGLMGNLYVTLALLFSFIADASSQPSSAAATTSASDVQAQRRKDYGLAEGSIYIGIMVGPFLGGTIFKLTHSYMVPYGCSGGLSILLFAVVFFVQPNDTATAVPMQDALLLHPGGHDESPHARLHDVVVEAVTEEDAEEDSNRPQTHTMPWWNPFAPFVLLFGNKSRLMWSSVLLLAWMGQKGIDFLYNPFVHYEYNRGAFLIGIIATTKAVSSVVSNICCMRIFSRLKMRGETVLLIGCVMLILAYSLIGLSSTHAQPSLYFWIGVSMSGLAAFVSPMIRSLITGTVNKTTELNVNPVTLLGSIAAIESFCDLVVPFIYGFGLFDWLISIHRASFIFLLGAVFYFLAGLTIVVCGKRRGGGEGGGGGGR